MDHKEWLDELLYQNRVLSIKIRTLEERLNENKKVMEILNRQTDEWIKSYDKLLNDFKEYRDRSTK